MPITDDLVAFWTLKDSDFTDHVGSNDLTNSGADTATGVCGDTVVLFTSGTADSLSCTSTSDLQLGNEIFYFGGYAYTANSNQGAVGGPLLAKADTFPADHDYKLDYDDAATVKFVWKVTSSDGLSQSSVTWDTGLSLGTWYYVEVYHDSANDLIGIAVTVPGSAIATWVTAAWSGGIRQTTGDFGMGTQPGVGSYHYNDGRMQSWGLWKGRIPNDTERFVLAGGQNAGCPPNFPFAPQYTRVWGYVG